MFGFWKHTEEDKGIVFSEKVYKKSIFANFKVDYFILASLIVSILLTVYTFSYMEIQKNKIQKLKTDFNTSYDKIIEFNNTISGIKDLSLNTFDWKKVINILSYLEDLWLSDFKLEYDNTYKLYFVKLDWVSETSLEKIKSVNDKKNVVDITKTFSTVTIVWDKTFNLKIIFY